MSTLVTEPNRRPSTPDFWVIWTVSERGEWHDGFVATYFQIIETAANGHFRRIVHRIERNNALNRAAFSLGQLVGGGVLSEAVVVDRLTGAARSLTIGVLRALASHEPLAHLAPALELLGRIAAMSARRLGELD